MILGKMELATQKLALGLANSVCELWPTIQLLDNTSGVNIEVLVDFYMDDNFCLLARVQVQ